MTMWEPPVERARRKQIQKEKAAAEEAAMRPAWKPTDVAGKLGHSVAG